MSFINFGVIPKEQSFMGSLADAGANLLTQYTNMSNYYDSPEYKLAMARLQDTQDKRAAMQGLQASNPGVYTSVMTGAPLYTQIPADQAYDYGKIFQGLHGISPEEQQLVQAKARSGMNVLPSSERSQIAVNTATEKIAPKEVEAKQVAIDTAKKNLSWIDLINEANVDHTNTVTKYIPYNAKTSRISANATYKNAMTEESLSGPRKQLMEAQKLFIGSQTESLNTVKAFSAIAGPESKFQQGFDQRQKQAFSELNATGVSSKPYMVSSIFADKWNGDLSASFGLLSGVGNLKDEDKKGVVESVIRKLKGVSLEMQGMMGNNIQGKDEKWTIFSKDIMRQANAMFTDIANNPTLGPALASRMKEDYEISIRKSIDEYTKKNESEAWYGLRKYLSPMYNDLDNNARKRALENMFNIKPLGPTIKKEE